MNMSYIGDMSSIEFVCFFEKLQKKLKIEIDTNLIEKIFHYYEGEYENYTLIELIEILNKNKIEISCSWNKRKIIKMIEDKNYDIPRKKKRLPSYWEYSSFDLKEPNKTNLFYTNYLYINGTFELRDDDMIMLENDHVYFIYFDRRKRSVKDKNYSIMVTLSSFEDYVHREYVIDMNDFINILDYNNVSIIQCKSRSYIDKKYFSEVIENGNYNIC